MRTIVRLGLVIVSLSAPLSLQSSVASIVHAAPARSLGKRLVSGSLAVGNKLWRSVGAEKLIAASLCSGVASVICSEFQKQHKSYSPEYYRWEHRQNACITALGATLFAAFPKFMLDHQQETVFKPLYKFFIQKPFTRGAQLKDRVAPLLVASPLFYALAKKAYHPCRSYLKRKKIDGEPLSEPLSSLSAFNKEQA